MDVPDTSHVYADTSLPGVSGWVIDPAPLARGEHPVRRMWRDPVTCDWHGGWYAYGPLPPADHGLAAPPALGGPATGPSTMRALLVMGDDPGAVEDAQAWATAVTSLGGTYKLLIAPTPDAVFDGVSATCLDVSEDDTALLVTTGRGSPAGGGSLILGAEAVSVDGLMAHVANTCQGAGLVITVTDASYAPRLDATWPAEAPPLIAWRGSDDSAPDAARRRVAGGGLLSGALAAHLVTVAAADCLGSGDATPWELTRPFTDKADVLLRMDQMRWAEVGAPRLAEEARPGLHRRQELAAWALGGLPTDVMHTTGQAKDDMGCTHDGECWHRAAECTLAPCQRMACLSGRCVTAIDEGRSE